MAKKTAASPKKKTTSRKKTATRKKTTSPKRASIATGRAKDKNLVVVESPAKARTLERYLGPDFAVVASVGHVIDLPRTRLAVDVEHDFEPEYSVIKGKKSILDAIKKEARVARAVYLAPDPDREGEAIAYHIGEYIRDANAEIHRVTFNEITQRAVQAAVAHPSRIDTALFEAQQARRVLDRLVGYKLSPLLWRKVRRGLSAGRVQSVAVRLICMREREIEAFEKEEYWSIEGRACGSHPPPFKIQLAKIDGKKAAIPDRAAADAILAEVEGAAWRVGAVVKREVAKRPFPPFITSTLQQEASRKLRMTAKRTMAVAQQLYEGVELGEMGQTALITYMRTDSTRLSDDAVGQAREEIADLFGADYLPEKPRKYSAKKGAQDAHEAIRPTDFKLTPDLVAPHLEPHQLALYTMIWQRAVACQTRDARLERTRIEMPVGRLLFTATGSVIKFDGFLRVYQEARDEAGRSESDQDKSAEPVRLSGDEDVLPSVNEGDELTVTEMKGSQHFTQPPPRFTEAGLVRELEKQGIGRPSTYASIISTIQDKEYALKEKGGFHPTELGLTTTDLLAENFPRIMDVKFTAKMEEQLDSVEKGDVNWVALLREFYEPFAQELETAETRMRSVKREAEATDFVCEKCSSPMVIRWGRNGRFLACSAFPKCRNAKNIEDDGEGGVRIVEEEKTDRKCPECGSPMRVRQGRNGRFLACTAYPKCKTTQPYPIGVPCGDEGCDGELVERRSKQGRTFYSCSRYPECRFSVSEKPYRQVCEECKMAKHFIGQGSARKVLCCNKKECLFPEVKTPEAS